MKNNDIIRFVLLSVLFIALGVGMTVSFLTGSVFVFLCVLIPILTFVIVFIFMDLQKKKVEKHLNESFGQNVVKISKGIISYFEFPLTLLLTLVLTLFFFSFAVIAVVFWVYQFQF